MNLLNCNQSFSPYLKPEVKKNETIFLKRNLTGEKEKENCVSLQTSVVQIAKSYCCIKFTFVLLTDFVLSRKGVTKECNFLPSYPPPLLPFSAI